MALAIKYVTQLSHPAGQHTVCNIFTRPVNHELNCLITWSMCARQMGHGSPLCFTFCAHSQQQQLCSVSPWISVAFLGRSMQIIHWSSSSVFSLASSFFLTPFLSPGQVPAFFSCHQSKKVVKLSTVNQVFFHMQSQFKMCDSGVRLQILLDLSVLFYFLLLLSLLSFFFHCNRIEKTSLHLKTTCNKELEDPGLW